MQKEESSVCFHWRRCCCLCCRSAEIITSNVRLRNKHLYHSLLSLNERGFGEKQELGVDQRDNYNRERARQPVIDPFNGFSDRQSTLRIHHNSSNPIAATDLVIFAPINSQLKGRKKCAIVSLPHGGLFANQPNILCHFQTISNVPLEVLECFYKKCFFFTPKAPSPNTIWLHKRTLPDYHHLGPLRPARARPSPPPRQHNE